MKKQAEKTLRGGDWGGVLSSGYDVMIKFMNSMGLWLSIPDQAGQTCNTGRGETEALLLGADGYWQRETGSSLVVGRLWQLVDYSCFIG